jgi:hypothetical protein
MLWGRIVERMERNEIPDWVMFQFAPVLDPEAQMVGAQQFRGVKSERRRR